MYHITTYTKQKAKALGLTVRRSRHPQKKIDVFRDGICIASIGAIGYSDYPHYIQERGKAYADQRRALYHKRHRKHTERNAGQTIAMVTLP